jgi:serine/threonine-protein kinase SRPK3
VESIIQAELANASASASSPPTKLVGVPPSKGRGGNHTPRSESVFITGSQPLPSPSSSFGNVSALDKWAFGMSKIDGEASGSKPASLGAGASFDTSSGVNGADDRTMESAAEGLSNFTLDSNGFSSRTNAVHPPKLPGPSLLSQQAPTRPRQPSGPHTPTSPPPSYPSTFTSSDAGLPSSAMSVDSQPSRMSTMDTDRSSVMEVNEKITVKIADLGNGESTAP